MVEEVPHAEHVAVKHEWDKTEDTPQITGIPPDVMVLSELETLREQMEEIKQKMDSMKDDIKKDFRGALTAELDKREVGGGAYIKMNEMIDKMDKMMKALKD